MTIKNIYKLYLQHPRVITDSRKIVPGCIFIALKGENFNGNKFAEDAINKGAVCAIIDEEEFTVPNRTILVEDTLQTLQKLAHLHRKTLGLPILGITGSNGKTTTKELLAAVLSQKFNLSFTKGNLNNHIGVPLTLLEMNSNTEFGIVEMGANHPGDIADLCKITDPDYGIITNIGKAHLKGFGSFEGVKKTKGELYDYLKKKKGTVFFNKDNSILTELSLKIENKVSYGETDADFTGEVLNSPPFVHLKANFPRGVLYLNTNLTGSYNFENILAAACIGNFFKVDPIKIQHALKEYQPSNQRSQLINKGDVKIIMDAYNANPTSMKASIKSFLNGFSNTDTYLILGDMLELGEYSQSEHAAVLQEIRNHPVKNVFLTGAEFRKVAKALPFKTFENVESLCTYLHNHPVLDGAVLIKGSRGIQLEKTLDCF